MTAIIDNRRTLRLAGDENYICTPCAQERDAIWPEQHVATFHHGICHYCGVVTDLASIKDWDWLNNSKRPKANGAARD
jgi:hypothetical protein